MGGIAFVFSGQGDQYPGMGQALAQPTGNASGNGPADDRRHSGF